MRTVIQRMTRKHAVFAAFVLISATSLLAIGASPRRGWVLSFSAESPDRTGYSAVAREIDFASHLKRAGAPPAPVARSGPGMMQAPRLHPRENGLDMTGTVNAEWGPSGVRIRVDAIVNSRNSASGPLRLALWATTDFPVFGTSINFFDLGGGSLGSLPAMSQFTNADTGLQPYSPPPSGCYWITVALIENVQGMDFYTDLVTAENQFAFGSGSCSQPTPTLQLTPTTISTAEPTVEPTVEPTPTGPCMSDSDTLCLNEARFRVEASFTRPNGVSGTGKVVKLTNDTGYFWFFNEENVEMVVKVLNACSGSSGRYWVFAGGLTNVEVHLTVIDTGTNTVKQYHNPLNTPFQPIQDTNAFATCP